MTKSENSIWLPSRRDVAKGLLGLGLAGGAMALGARNVLAQSGTRTVRWWSAQNPPAQVAAYRYQIAAFQDAHPDIEIILEQTSDEGYPVQMAAAFASGQLPGLVTHLPALAVQSYWQQGLLEPMNDVVAAIGEDKFYKDVNKIFETENGDYSGLGIGNTAANMLWVRKDLMAAAGITKIPETWDELRQACQAMQKGGVYGAPLPYANNAMTSMIIVAIIHQGGGQVFTPDLTPDLTTDAVHEALEFYASMRDFCPPGATNYSWGESLTAFVSGGTATGIYGGRVLANVIEQNPSIADQVTCAVYPVKEKGMTPFTFNGFPSVFIPRAAPDVEAAKLLAAWIFQGEGYVKQLLAAPGHTLPVIKAAAEAPEYVNDPTIQRYHAEVTLMTEAAANGFNLGWESREHQANPKAGEIISSLVLSEMVQRVVLQDESVQSAAAWAQDKLGDMMKAS